MKFELIIYGENDEVVKKYGTDHIRYGILEDALDISEKLQTSGNANRLDLINPLILRIFKGLTEEELKEADLFDVMNVFEQVIAMSKGLRLNNSSEKN